MPMQAATMLMLLWSLCQLAAETDAPAENTQRTIAKLSEIDLPPELLAGEWRRVAGLRIDNLNQLDRLPPQQQPLAAGLRQQMAPQGVIGVADYSLASQTFPLNTVTVRVFLFSDEEKCQDWWHEKYAYAGWRQHYERVDNDAMNVLDSRQTTKRIYQFGNAWITAHQLGEGSEHQIAAQHVITALTQAKQATTDE